MRNPFTTHHREIKYRPPRKNFNTGDTGKLDLYLYYARRYLLPYKWKLLLCMTIVSLSGASVYAMAFFAKYVVDDVLMVQTSAAPAPETSVHFDRAPSTTRRQQPDTSPNLPTVGAEHRRDLAFEPPIRAPNAGRTLLIVFLLHITTIITLNHLARVANRNQIIIGQNLAANLRDDLHKKVLDLSLAYHKSNSSGRLLARIMSDVDVVQKQLMMTIIQLTQASAAVLVGATILIVSEWRIAIIAALSAPLYGLIWAKTRDSIRELAIEARHTNSCMYGLISQKLEGVKAIQAYGREGTEMLNFHRLSACFLRDALCQQRQGAFVNSLCTVVASCTTMTVLIIGSRFVVHDQMSLGKMLFVYGAAANVFGPVLMITQVGVVFSRLLVILQRLSDILDEPVDISTAPDAIPFPSPLTRGISLRRVNFTYGEAGDHILHDISMDIKAGSWVCIMGPSGCGKTSILYLLSRLYEPTGGTITVDGLSLAKIDISSLRERMALVPQEAQIFRGTVRDNIAYGHPGAEPSQIMNAAKAAEMHELIMGMKVKYETLLGERGTDLSGGQRQRLSLARALLTDPDVLLLDDCTSALDAETEHRIQETLTHIMKGKTAIIVSQRVSMALRCDHIYVIQEGSLTEQGSPDELLANDGFFKRLHSQQTE